MGILRKGATPARTAAIVLGLSACLAASAARADVAFATGRQGGSQYPVSVALSQIMEKAPGVGSVSLVPGGGAANIVAVDNGQAELGITLSVSVRDGMLGNPPYKKKTENVVQLFSLHAFKVAVIVPEESPVKTFKDLAGKRVNTGPKGFTIVELGGKLLAMDNVKVDMRYLQIGQAVEQFKDGNIDALFYSPSDRFPAFMDLAQARKIRLIEVPKSVRDKIMAEDPSFYPTTFPEARDAYKNLSNQVPTLGYTNIIIANKNKLTDEQAYGMTKLVAENIEKVAAVEADLRDWDPKQMAIEVGIPVHPGSMRYFKERGWK